MIRTALVLLSTLALAACDLPAGPPLVSGQFPPNAMSANSEPQPLNSLPPGAGNFSRAPNAVQPNYLSFKIGGR